MLHKRKELKFWLRSRKSNFAQFSRHFFFHLREPNSYDARLTPSYSHSVLTHNRLFFNSRSLNDWFGFRVIQALAESDAIYEPESGSRARVVVSFGKSFWEKTNIFYKLWRDIREESSRFYGNSRDTKRKFVVDISYCSGIWCTTAPLPLPIVKYFLIKTFESWFSLATELFSFPPTHWCDYFSHCHMKTDGRNSPRESSERDLQFLDKI